MPFSRNLRKMIMTTPEDGKSTVHHAIMKAYLLLGRVNEHVHSLEASSDPDEHYPSQPDTNASFEYCVSAARNMARLIQEATRISIDALINPHIGSSLYVCGKILILHTHLTKSDEVRTDIDMFLLLCDRIADVYPTLGTKFKNGMRYDLKQDAKGVRKMREDGARGMMTKCGDWAGANPQATLEKLTAAFGR
ncbi:f-actin capping protein beta subunit [Neofusicoccum parvum]|nr:f-actin capping protein beta subunit [Neofusicoccum parvum]